jgi:hypothetical protein
MNCRNLEEFDWRVPESRKEGRRVLADFMYNVPVPKCAVRLLSGEITHLGPFNFSFILDFGRGYFRGSTENSDHLSAVVIGTTICETWEDAINGTNWQETELLEITLIKSDCGARFQDVCRNHTDLVGILNRYFQAVHPEYADMIKVHIETDLLDQTNQSYWYPRKYVPEKYICEKKYIWGKPNPRDSCILR